MSELFLYYVATLGFISVVVAMLLVYRYYLGNRLVEQTKKLRAEINRFPKDLLEMPREPSGIVSSGMGELGIEGIMNELGIDPGILKNPLVKGLVEKYAPRVIESLSKSQKGKQGAGAEEFL